MRIFHRHLIRHLWLPLAASLGVYLTVHASQTGRFDPTHRLYGYNWPYELHEILLQIAWETSFLYVMLRPWSYRHSWRRASFALILWMPWTLLTTVATMHSGSIGFTHVMWLWSVMIGLLSLMVISFISARRQEKNTG